MSEESTSLWGAMERLRLSTVAGLDRLDAAVARAKKSDEEGADLADEGGIG